MTVDGFIERLCRSLQLSQLRDEVIAEDNRHFVSIPEGRSVSIDDIQRFAAEFYGRYQLLVGLYESVPATACGCGFAVRSQDNRLYRVIYVTLRDVLDIKIDTIY